LALVLSSAQHSATGSRAGKWISLLSYQLIMQLGFRRYNYSKKKFLYSQLQPAMKKQAIYEGTALDEEMRSKSR